MTAPATVSDFLTLVQQSGLLDDRTIAKLRDDEELPADPFSCAEVLVQREVLTAFQAAQLLKGRYRGMLVGPYRLLAKLGKGGMGVVYLAAHAELGRKVALKMLKPDPSNERLSVERFQREARAVAALDHPNIVRLYDVTKLFDRHFIVMEYVDGVGLGALVAQTGPLHPAQAVDYVLQAAAGLRHAHEKGFIHRDIKPDNLMLAKDGMVKILDMGLARAVADPKDELTALHNEGSTIVGTVDFISPEQALNARTDARGDVYSLGATLYALVSGQPPFVGTTTQKLAQHQLRLAPALREKRPSVPVGLSDVVARMMAKHPGDRYPSMTAVIDALAPWATTAPAPEPPPPPLADEESPEPPARPRRWVWAVAIGVLLTVAVGAVAFALGRRDKSATAPEPVRAPVEKANAPVEPAPPIPINPKPADPPEVVVYRLDLGATRPFAHTNTGRTVGTAATFDGAPPGWGTHSWFADCTHEFFAEAHAGRTALGLRYTRADPKGIGGMLYAGGIEVVPGRGYVLRFAYRTSGAFAPADVRILEVQGKKLRVAGPGRLTATGGEWVTVSLPYRHGAGSQIQIEFHHNGPVGAGNDLQIRALELLDADARPPG